MSSGLTVKSRSDVGASTVNRGTPSSRFKNLADYSRATGQDRYSIEVDYDIFVNVKRLDAQDLQKVQALYNAEDFDFRLNSGSTPLDRGVVLPNITDEFTGKAPDLGALEWGKPIPHYGPRP